VAGNGPQPRRVNGDKFRASYANIDFAKKPKRIIRKITKAELNDVSLTPGGLMLSFRILESEEVPTL